MRIIDTTDKMFSAFDGENFDLEKWQIYMDTALPEAGELCLKDLRENMETGYSWENDCLPVLNAVIVNRDKTDEAIRSFHEVTCGLEEKIVGRFGRSIDVDVILYLGLCSGAGWVTTVNGRNTILLGIEKITELNWCDKDSMTGLIIHELGHACQAQYGELHRETSTSKERFLWQLFTEGIAMVFEQEIVGEPEYFHQDRDGWKAWCDSNYERIRDSFALDAETMTARDQRYFGDWVSFEGHSDTGYYLGTRFVRFLMEQDDFDHIIGYEVKEVCEGFERFMAVKSEEPEEYVCKIASMEEVNRRWDTLIRENPDDPNWVAWRKTIIAGISSGRELPYYGILNGEIICEAYAVLNYVPKLNYEWFYSQGRVYLYAFRTVDSYRGMGYFSKLIRFMLEDLRQRGLVYAVVGVEPKDEVNKQRYIHWGFDNKIHSGTLTYEDGTVIDVDYYGQYLLGETMKNVLYIGFKGKNNSSEILVKSLSGQYSLLTNSFAGLKRDIDQLAEDYDEVYLFGVDKNLSDSFRIERYAEKEGKRLTTIIDLNGVAEWLSVSGINSTISSKITQYLCNEAYWYLLEKYRGRAVLIHIPTVKLFNEIMERCFKENKRHEE